jgi:hypothetical protein
MQCSGRVRYRAATVAFIQSIIALVASASAPK